MAFHQTHALLAIASGRSSHNVSIYQFSAAETDVSQPVQVLIGHNRSVTAISFCKGGSQERIRIATGDEEGTIMIWLMGYDECVHTFNSPFAFSYFSRNMVSSIDWLDGDTLATTHHDNHVNVIKCIGGVVLGVQSFKPMITEVQCIKFHPNGRFFATCSASPGLVKLWDSSSFECKFTFACRSSAFSMQFNAL